MTIRHWFPRVTSEPPPAPLVPPAITEGSSRSNMKREHFREMPKGPPPALQPKPTLTDAEREAVELFASLNWTSIRWSAVEKHAATLITLLERLK